MGYSSEAGHCGCLGRPMNKASIVAQLRGMLSESTVEISNTPDGGTAQTVVGFRANKRVDERQIPAGATESYYFSVWTIKDDWTFLPEKGDVVTVDSEEYRIRNSLDYYMGAAVRWDLGAKFEERTG